MATSLNVDLQLTGQASMLNALDHSSVATSIQIASTSFPAQQLSLSFGTGDNQANMMWSDKRTLANGADDDLDLAGGITDSFGSTITFTYVKNIIVAMDSVDGTNAVRIGPQGVTNAWQGPWGGVAAGNYLTVLSRAWIACDGYTGHAVTAGTGDILRIHNASGVSVDYHLWIIGIV